ncbi:MAG: peptidoglycan-binding protein [Hyphomicrobiales bacterium]|nr:peptidoglycan-binding protein [Hyphomicrobiales bacterium]
MNKSVPWSIKGVGFDVREAAKDAAQRAGMTLGEWLHSVIAESASDSGVEFGEIDEEDQLEAVTARLARLSEFDDPRPARRSARPVANVRKVGREARFEAGSSISDDEDSPPQRRRAETRRATPRVETTRETRPRMRLPEARSEHLLDEAVEMFESRHRQQAERTEDALSKVARRLAEIEGHISQRDESSHLRPLRSAMASLEERVEQIARRKEPAAKNEQALAEIESQLSRLADRLPRESSAPEPVAATKAAAGDEHLRRIEDKLNLLISSLDAPSEVVFPAGRNAKPGPITEDGPASSAISEIMRRQKSLDRTHGFDPQQGLAPAPVPSARDPLAMPAYATAPMQAAESDGMQAALHQGMTSLAEQLQSLRHESAQRDERRKAEAARVAHPDLDFLRHQLAEISRAIGLLAQRGTSPGLEEAVHALVVRIDESRRNGVQDGALAPIEGVLNEIRHSLAASSPHAIAEAMREELRRLHQKIDAMTATGFDRSGFEKLKRQTDEIGRMLSDVLARPMSTEGLERQIAGLSERVDQLAARPDALSSYLVETLDSIRDSIDRVDSNPALRDVERRVADLTARSGQMPASLVEMLEEMRYSIDSVAANPALRAVQAQISELAAKSGDLPHRLVETLTDLRQSIEKVAANPGLRAIEAQVANLASRTGEMPDHLVETLSQIRQSIDRMAANAGLRAAEGDARSLAPHATALPEHLTETLGEMRQSIERMAHQPALRALESHVSQLAHKIDAAIAQPRPAWDESATGDTQKIYSRISDLHDVLMSRLDKSNADPALPAFGEQIAALSQRIDSVHRAVVRQRETENAAPPPRDERLEEMVGQLAAKIERVSAGNHDTRALQALENQVMRLAERLERSGESSEAISALERTMADLFGQLEETRNAAIDAAEAAARDAVRDTALAPTAASGIAPDVIVREISDLRTMQDQSDRRTHSTLTAVHETLEKVVDRLALLEDDIGGLRAQDMHAEVPLAAGPMPTFEAARPAREGLANETPSRAANIDPASMRPERRPVADAAPKVQVAAPAAAPASTDADDILIEPGSGFSPTPRRGSAQHEADLDPTNGHSDLAMPMGNEPKVAQASFIAAARRAAHTTGQSASEAPSRIGRVASSVEAALNDARSRARAAASATDETAEPGVKSPGGMALLKGKARPILISLAGLVLLIGALQVARSLTDHSGGEQPMVESQPKLSQGPSTSPSAQPAGKAEVVNAPAARAEKRADMMLSPEPMTSRQQAEQTSDPVVVSSIPKPPVKTAALADLANAGNADAQYELAARYIDGRDMPRDPAMAVQWFRKAAEKNSAPAQYRLGALYEKGIGVTRSSKDAAIWYRKAADAGNVRAMHNLAVLMADGVDGKPDYSLAASWFQNAAEHGVRDSQYNLAILYARGLGVEQDLTKSYKWLALAAAQGDTDALKKRDEVAARLQPRQLAEAKVAADTFALQAPVASANEASIDALLSAPRADGRPVSATPPASAPRSGSKATDRVSSL